MPICKLYVQYYKINFLVNLLCYITTNSRVTLSVGLSPEWRTSDELPSPWFVFLYVGLPKLEKKMQNLMLTKRMMCHSRDISRCFNRNTRRASQTYRLVLNWWLRHLGGDTLKSRIVQPQWYPSSSSFPFCNAMKRYSSIYTSYVYSINIKIYFISADSLTIYWRAFNFSSIHTSSFSGNFPGLFNLHQSERMQETNGCYGPLEWWH